MILNISVAKGFRDCKKLKDFGIGCSGIYNISIGCSDSSFVTVYCDQETDEGGWLVSAHTVRLFNVFPN